MKKNYWLILFIIVLAADLVFIYGGEESLRYLSKSLIVPVLAGYFYSGVRGRASGLSKWIILALLFSWLGDIFLLFESSDKGFFLAGLMAFLFAHFFYITFFSSVQREETIRPKPLLGILAIVWYVLLMKFIKPGDLGSLAVPVRIYGAVIMIMFWMALQMLYSMHKTAGIWMIAGATLFAISDSVLALDRYFRSIDNAGLIVILTYGLAQLLLTEGAMRYIQKSTAR